MGQVPKYGVIGSGRMARHMIYYLKDLNIPYVNWCRKSHTIDELYHMVDVSDRILLLITDSEIEGFINQNSYLLKKSVVHFSGSLSVRDAYSAHPLMTFSDDLYDLAMYRKIPFVVESEGPPFHEILPGLDNPNYAISRSLKSFYHSLCVMSNNFSCMLWLKFYQELEQTFQLPKEILKPYIIKTFENILNNPKQALTGPLVRNDTDTISRNLKALEKDPFNTVYQAFLDVYQLGLEE